ncbi:MAG TPA: hypothetical protein VEX67_18050 [Solirubrobacteraceae bacterium]|nr:hypothetical protein [Solirubrobacteraceae bacterium]
MAWQTRVLVIANVTANSPELVAALRTRAESGPIVPTLLMPATRNGFAGKEEAGERLEAALAQWRDAGLEASGIVGDPDPVVAMHETWDPRSYDEVIVSTLPGQSSKWLQFDLPHRVRQITGLDVTHVEAGRKNEPHYGPPPEKRAGALGPLTLRAPKRR